MTPKSPALIAVTAIFTAVIFIIISQIPPIPIPATSGYFNLGETAIYVAALLFGPFVGAFAGGIGAALSDVYLGFAHFAPGTLIIKGLEGAVVGLLNIKLKKRIQNTSLRAIISVIIGGSVMVLGYFLYENLLAVFIPGLEIYALIEVPFNIAQMLVGLVIAVPIVHAVQRVFPQVKSYL
ncbi:ECF transporter S component [Candidatus Bathycorpusculum sp.]|uniref:ECF transporter S component n=1 Tax=Candidatus Bathycorpusculum sp. TaxID=2994959 RepID=UPI0028246145|nr:ECF transporter S component [Candidatus Termitimicrobium sp.]MCL2686406.1 ECF transporter S component [Candidatus Termitimicrobium sp.]